MQSSYKNIKKVFNEVEVMDLCHKTLILANHVLMGLAMSTGVLSCWNVFSNKKL